MKKVNKTKPSDMERIDKASLLEVIDQALVKFDENLFRIKRHSDATILIYDKNDNVLYEPVKPILRKINISNNLGVDLFHLSGSKKNTRVLGKDIIKRLNEKIL